jgi:hypothetical protein
VDIGRGDVDHVVVGPTGVFAVETKNWPGRVEVRGGALYRNGRRDETSLRQAIRAAIAIRERTGVRRGGGRKVVRAAVTEPLPMPIHPRRLARWRRSRSGR